MIGIVKGGKHSYDDFGLTVRDATTETKKKNKTLVKIPFMNGSYDFSSLYGGQTYEEETRTYEFNLIAKDKYDLEIQKIRISDWLLDGEQAEIYDDLLVGYHRLAECVDLSFEENHNYAKVIANFRTYPFKIRNEYEGDDVWDTFNFELDVAQDVIVREEDCGTLQGVVVEEIKDEKAGTVIESLYDRILGRFTNKKVVNPETGEVIAERNEYITEPLADKIIQGPGK